MITPIGYDLTTAVAELKLDAPRTVAVDVLFGMKGPRTLMVTPATDPDYRDAAHGLLAGDGQSVVVINDSPGFVAQRVVAMIVNIALRHRPARHRHAGRHRPRRGARPRLSVRAARVGRSASARGACCSSWSGCRRSMASRAIGRRPGSSGARRSGCRCRRRKGAR